jgi:hypothetical protein
MTPVTTAVRTLSEQTEHKEILDYMKRAKTSYQEAYRIVRAKAFSEARVDSTVDMSTPSPPSDNILKTMAEEIAEREGLSLNLATQVAYRRMREGGLRQAAEPEPTAGQKFAEYVRQDMRKRGMSYEQAVVSNHRTCPTLYRAFEQEQLQG